MVLKGPVAFPNKHVPVAAHHDHPWQPEITQEEQVVRAAEPSMQAHWSGLDTGPPKVPEARHRSELGTHWPALAHQAQDENDEHATHPAVVRVLQGLAPA